LLVAPYCRVSCFTEVSVNGEVRFRQTPIELSLEIRNIWTM
jgi:hypothetical protein